MTLFKILKLDVRRFRRKGWRNKDFYIEFVFDEDEISLTKTDIFATDWEPYGTEGIQRKAD